MDMMTVENIGGEITSVMPYVVTADDQLQLILVDDGIYAYFKT